MYTAPCGCAFKTEAEMMTHVDPDLPVILMIQAIEVYGPILFADAWTPTESRFVEKLQGSFRQMQNWRWS